MERNRREIVRGRDFLKVKWSTDREKWCRSVAYSHARFTHTRVEARTCCTMITGERCSSDVRWNEKFETRDRRFLRFRINRRIDRTRKKKRVVVVEIETRREIFTFKEIARVESEFFLPFVKNKINGRCKIQEIKGDLILSKRFRDSDAEFFLFFSFFIRVNGRVIKLACRLRERNYAEGFLKVTQHDVQSW